MALFMESGVIRLAQRSICPRTVSVCHVITLETTSGSRTRCMTSLYHQSVGTGCVVIETETSGVWYIRYGAQYYLNVRQFLYAIYDDIFLLIKTIVNFFYLWILMHVKTKVIYHIMMQKLLHWHAFFTLSRYK